MSDNDTFVDSNVLLYLFGDDNVEKDFARSLLTRQHTISIQVISENVNVCLRKLKFTKEVAFHHGLILINAFHVIPLTDVTLQTAMRFSFRYELSYWDSLIVAAAYENNCTTLLSEDTHDGLIVKGKLTIKIRIR